MSGRRPTSPKWSTATGSPSKQTSNPGSDPDAQKQERWLIERAQQGDHEAFARLLQLHQRRVFSVITNLLRRPGEVEDLAQQVFLKVYLALPRFDFRAAFSTWLYRITVNECLDHLRRQRALKAPARREVQFEDPADLEQVLATATEGSADPERRASLKDLVEKLFARLPAEDRVLLSLREVEGFSVEEIAATLKLNENTVKVRLFRARQRLLEAYRRVTVSDAARRR